MHLPSTWTQSPSRPANVMLAPVPAAAEPRITEMTAGLTEASPGRFTISRRAAPSAEERRWLERRREHVLDALTPGGREAIEDKLHGFAFGFSQLRSLDPDAMGAALMNYVDAVDHLPLEAVVRALRAWNKHRFKWANPAFPPQAPELAKAATEMWCEIKMEERALRNILSAEVAGALPPPRTDAERDADVGKWEALRTDILAAASMKDRVVTEAGTDSAERRAALEHLKTLKQPELDPAGPPDEPSAAGASA